MLEGCILEVGILVEEILEASILEGGILVVVGIPDESNPLDM